MAEYIEREKAYTLAKKICDAVNSGTRALFLGRDILDWIDDLPAADVRPVVLCRDCKNRFNIDVCKCRGDDWFCGYGERKREES